MFYFICLLLANVKTPPGFKLRFSLPGNRLDQGQGRHKNRGQDLAQGRGHEVDHPDVEGQRCKVLLF